jgi:hypothetical protein
LGDPVICGVRRVVGSVSCIGGRAGFLRHDRIGIRIRGAFVSF